MTDEAIRRLSDAELAREIDLCRRQATGEYIGRERRPGRRYHEWCDRRDAARKLLPRLERERRERDPEKPMTLESFLAEYYAERDHQRGA